MYKNIYNYNIPLILLNARLTKKTFNRWIKIKYFSKSIFNKILIAYPQNIETKKFLKKINPQKIKMLGNLKFARNNEEIQSKINQLKDFLDQERTKLRQPRDIEKP